jgi:hypothetical protein
LNSVETFAEEIKSSVSAMWSRVMGGIVQRLVVPTDDIRKACEEASAAIRENFSLTPDKTVSDDTVRKAAVEAGVRSLATGEVHRKMQLSRAKKIQSAANDAVFIVRDNGGIDILRGKEWQ